MARRARPQFASIGIEIANPGHDGGLPAFPQAQIDATIALVRDIAARRAIRPERVLAHSDVAPARKRDPGERFPWDALARAGVGHWVEPAPIVDGPLFGPGRRDRRSGRCRRCLRSTATGSS